MCTRSHTEARESFWRDIARIDRLICRHEKKLKSCNNKKRKCYRILSLLTDYDNWLSETCERYAWKVRALRRVQTGSIRGDTHADEKYSSGVSDCAPRRTPCEASKQYGHLAKWTSVHAAVGERLHKRRKEKKLRGGKLARQKTGVYVKGEITPRLNCTCRGDDPSRRGNKKVQEDAEEGVPVGEGQEEKENEDEAVEDHRKDAPEDNPEEVYENKGELPREANRTGEENAEREADSSGGIHPNEETTVVEREDALEAVEERKIYSTEEKEKEEETEHFQMLHNSVGEKNEDSLERVPSGIGGSPHKMGKDQEEEGNRHNELEFSEVQVREVTLEEGEIQRGGSPDGGEEMAEVRQKAEKEKKTKGKKGEDKKGDTKKKKARKGEKEKGKKKKKKEKQTMLVEGEERENAAAKTEDQGKEVKMEEEKEENIRDEEETKLGEEQEVKVEEEKETTVNEGKEENMEGEKEQRKEEVEEVRVEKQTEENIEDERNTKLDVEKEAMYTEGEKQNVSEEPTIGDEEEAKADEQTEHNIGDENEVNSDGEEKAKLSAANDEPSEMLNQGEQKTSDNEDDPGKTAENEIVHHILSEYSNTIQYKSFLDYIKNKKEPE
ncbi:Uncharacterized protein PCOAH_00008410 [Plasmodium coatneyi]|uniref:Uncharacterized protein n=1 Tax=Plasmodium coatneyi TaxID=208452 RepID=A0A1B1DUX9_9APIC|nr:Uncharacterized protein PCOAH_00008410 [Plasmodium coatneyi]ANQ06385.1 Uncharacterized protein PCOAH_00008410 [Plasmodium coatneyi]